MKKKPVRSLCEQIEIETQKFSDRMKAIFAQCSPAGIRSVVEEGLDFVDEPEPDKETPTGKKMFPGVHEGNMRRLIGRVLTAPEWADISISTRVWMMAFVLTHLNLMDNNDRGIKGLSVYAEIVLGIEIAYCHRKVPEYWRKNYPPFAKPAQEIGVKPRNADRVLKYAYWVKQCATDGERIDDRLWMCNAHCA